MENLSGIKGKKKKKKVKKSKSKGSPEKEEDPLREEREQALDQLNLIYKQEQGGDKPYEVPEHVVQMIEREKQMEEAKKPVFNAEMGEAELDGQLQGEGDLESPFEEAVDVSPQVEENQVANEPESPEKINDLEEAQDEKQLALNEAPAEGGKQEDLNQLEELKSPEQEKAGEQQANGQPEESPQAMPFDDKSPAVAQNKTPMQEVAVELPPPIEDKPEDIAGSGIQILKSEQKPQILEEIADQKQENDVNPFADQEPKAELLQLPDAIHAEPEIVNDDPTTKAQDENIKKELQLQSNEIQEIKQEPFQELQEDNIEKHVQIQQEEQKQGEQRQIEQQQQIVEQPAPPDISPQVISDEVLQAAAADQFLEELPEEDQNFKIELKPMIIVEKVELVNHEQAKIDQVFLEKHKGIMKGKLERAKKGQDKDQDSDEGEGLFKHDADHELSYERMNYMRNKNHPRQEFPDIVNNKITYGFHPICGTKTGQLCCLRKWRETDLSEYGNGIVLYFQLLKFLGALMLWMSICSIPNMLMFYHGSDGITNNPSINQTQAQPMEDEEFDAAQVIEAIQRVSLGNIGDNNMQCRAQNFTTNSSSLPMILQCRENLQINEIKLVQQIDSSDVRLNCRIDSEGNSNEMPDTEAVPPTCNISETSNWQEFYHNKFQDCLQYSKCAVDLYDIFYRDGIDQRPIYCSQMNQVEGQSDILEYGLQVQYKCQPTGVEVPYLNISISREDLALICILSDLFIILSLYLSLLLLKSFQQKTINDVQERLLTADDFAIVIKDLPKDSKNITELKANIWQWAENILNNSEEDLKNPETGRPDINQNKLYNIYIGIDNYWKMNVYLGIAELLKEKKKLTKKQKIKNKDYKDEIKYIDQMAKIKIRELKDQNQTAKPVIAFIQFMSMNGVTKFQNEMNIGFIQRCFLIMTCRKDKIRHKYLNNNIWPKLHPAPEPTLIMWNNLGIKIREMKIRRFIINVISIIVMVIGFAGISYGNKLISGKNDQESFDINDCSSIMNITEEMAVADFKDDLSSNTILGCYCYDKLQQVLQTVESLNEIDDLQQQLQFSDGSEHCKTWLQSYLFEQISSIAIAGGISIINILQLEFFSFISKYERNHFITEKLTSSLTKMFLSQFINMGLIVILMFMNVEEARLPDNFPILNGSFKKFTSDWYSVVGSTITMTMIIQIFAPHGSYIIKPFIAFAKRCWDRRCTLDEKKTRQILQDDYEQMYMGIKFDIDKRYSQILSQIFLIMTFSGGIPILYPVGMFCSIMCYWTDKFLFVRLYRKPPLYDSAMALRAGDIIKYSIIIHIMFSAYMYSNEQIFTYMSQNQTFLWVNQISADIVQMLFNQDLISFEQKLLDEGLSLKEYMVITKSHSYLYLLGLLCIIVLVILEEAFGILSLLGSCFVHIFKIDQQDNKELFDRLNGIQEKRDQGKNPKKKQSSAKINQVAPQQRGGQADQLTSANISCPEAIDNFENQCEGGDGADDNEAQINTQRALLGSSQANEVSRRVSTNLIAKTHLQKEIQNRMLNPNVNQVPLDDNGQVEKAQSLLKRKITNIPDFQVFRELQMNSGESFSCNFLSEIPIDCLQKEYNKAVIDAFEYRYDPLQLPQYYKYMQDDYRIYYSNRMNDRVHDVEKMLEVYLKSNNFRVTDLDDTKDQFKMVFEKMKDNANYYRLKSVHCYDIIEHPEFSKTPKIIKRAKEFFAKQFPDEKIEFV